MSAEQGRRFGEGDASFQAAGGIEGIERLVDDFYRIMEESEEAVVIRAMHAEDLTEVRDRLARFLCGWLGGPRRYAEKYGPINIPQFHARWPIGEGESSAWLLCMQKAIARQSYTPEFAEYLLRQLRVPASRIVEVRRRVDA
jgi:hemoglobin